MVERLGDEQVARLTRPERERRVTSLLSTAARMLDTAIETHVVADDRRLAGVCLLFSGGNDSTVLSHIFRGVATHAIHANTTIGLEATRDFVRNTCEEWGLPRSAGLCDSCNPDLATLFDDEMDGAA